MSQELEKNQQVFKFVELSKYSFKERWIIRLADLAFFSLIGLIGKTVKFEIEGWENFEQIEQAGKTPIYTFWHNRIFLATYFWRHRKIVVMTSQSLDGEYIARFIQRFGYGASRGSSTRGGIKSLVEMIRLMKDGLPTAFTIDGPKGPKYVAKAGAGLLAKKTGHPILPFSIESKKFWTVKSWDNLQIPKPFSRAKVLIDQPIYVSPHANDEEIENKRLELQNALDELVNRGVQWRESEN
jgi:hypothetical protein